MNRIVTVLRVRRSVPKEGRDRPLKRNLCDGNSDDMVTMTGLLASRREKITAGCGFGEWVDFASG